MEAGKALGMRYLAGYKKTADGAAMDDSAPGISALDACAMWNAATNTESQGLQPTGLVRPSPNPTVKK